MQAILRQIYDEDSSRTSSATSKPDKSESSLSLSTKICPGDRLFEVVCHFLADSRKDDNHYVFCKPRRACPKTFDDWVAFETSIDSVPTPPVIIVSQNNVMFMMKNESYTCQSLLDFLHEYAVSRVVRSFSFVKSYSAIKVLLYLRAKVRTRRGESTKGHS